ncbi:MAG: 4Fe-4S double cluster binding domain-containing protein [Bacillota bacterium]|nr:4Fe-4S double cluster binding domain-containing protein [Bacillota bacterium]
MKNQYSRLSLTKADIIHEAKRIGFDDIGFTTIVPFTSHLEILQERHEEYHWTEGKGLQLIEGTDPQKLYEVGKSIIVLLDNYHRHSFPSSLQGKFGRCYLDDDRIKKENLSLRLKAFREYLESNHISSKVPFNMPHRLAAARAGLGTFGKNCLFYSNKIARGSSFVIPVALIVSQEYEPDEPSIRIDCPSWCKNTCIIACPTGALGGNGKIDPRKCISYITYYTDEITPLDLRERMGMWIYGCDRCQEVCPRNQPWMAQKLPMHSIEHQANSFELTALLHMDRKYFKKHIWPQMFYTSADDLWRWHMNAARVMGNSLDSSYISDLTRAYKENKDDRVKEMCAWAIGRLGG